MHRITIIMPVYNPGKYLIQAIDSILNQTYKDFELLLIDDASTDNSVDIIKQIQDPRIRLIRNDRNLGISGTRNKGLELCNTEYIAFMDHDDIAIPSRLEKEIKYLEEHLEIDVVGGHLRAIDKEGNDLNKQWSVYLNPNYIKAYFLLDNTVANGTAMFRKSFVDQYKIRFQENCFGAEDYRFWVECSLRGKIANIDEVFLYWRTGHVNETSRVRGSKNIEREAAIREIQTYALNESGFRLSEDELFVLLKVFKEQGIVDNQEELMSLYQALKTISVQARELGIEYADEVATMCRKRFGEKVGKAFYLWK